MFDAAFAGPSAPDDLDLIADPRVALRNRARGKFEHAPRTCDNTRNAPRPKIFLDVNHGPVTVEEDYVNGEPHPQSVDAVRWNDPEAARCLSPSRPLAKQTHKPRQERIGDTCVRCE